MPSPPSKLASESPASSKSTVSIALPSSILLNAQSSELRIYLAGQVARAAAIFKIDEIVIFDELPDHTLRRRRDPPSNPSAFFKRVLDYLETPQYLRKHLFPVSSDLRLVGLLNPLALPHHVARDECTRWREGVSVTRTHSNNLSRNASSPPTKFVDVGLSRLVELQYPIDLNTRVTVDMSISGSHYDTAPGKYLFAEIAHHHHPTLISNLYWGYRVRTAPCLSDVFRNSLVCENYDLVLGTSERGTPIVGPDVHFQLPQFTNLLIVFGGVRGLEYSVRGDKHLEQLSISPAPLDQCTDQSAAHDVADLFDYYVNTCPAQGSRTIRTEEAILISLAALAPFLTPSSQA